MSGSQWNPEDAVMPDVDWSAGIIPGTTGNADPNAPGVAGTAGLAAGTGTGRLGIVPLEGTGGGMLGDGITSTMNWLNAPFTEPMSPTGLFLIVGVILVAIIAWNLILYHVRIAAETI
jgi:hypothetical protein